MTFKLGESGNPAGRPVGIVDKRVKSRALFEQHADTIIQKLIELATAGDPTALRLCIERIVPKIKPDNTINFDLPEGRIDTGDNMLQIANNLIKSVASGHMTIEEAEKFNVFLKQQRLLIDNAERKKYEEECKKETKY